MNQPCIVKFANAAFLGAILTGGVAIARIQQMRVTLLLSEMFHF
jgi:uncharacterized integral membrane protein